MVSRRLRDVPLFAGLSKRDLQEVSQIADEVDVKPGEVLARQGDLGQEFFVIEAGTARVTRDGEVLAELEAGDFFGEIALIEEERRMATVTAATPMTLIVLTGASFRSLKHRFPSVYSTVRDEIAKRKLGKS